MMNIPVVHCSGVQQPFTKTDRSDSFYLLSLIHTTYTQVLPKSERSQLQVSNEPGGGRHLQQASLR